MAEEKKSSIWSRIGSAFVTVEEQDKEESNNNSKAQSSEQNIPQTQAFSYGNNQIPQMNGTFDQNFHNYFTEVLEKNNLDGVDYFEFSKAKKNLDNTPGFTDPMKYQSAFGVLQASTNLTKERLLQTADHYIKVLEDEEKSFEESKQSELNSQVVSKTENASEKEKMIASKMEEINKLQADISQLRNEITVLINEAENNKFKIESTAKNFKYTLDVVKNQIASDKTNIQNYIQ